MLIGLCGPEGAGKSTAAKLLVQHTGAQVVPFAAPLKRMLEAMGVPAENLYGTPYDKERPLDLLCGKSARQAMQALGTEWGRNCIGPEVWLRAWRHMVLQLRDQANPPFGVIADDVRFPNEVEAIRELGGKVICIVRSMQDFRRTPKHASEHFQAIERDAVIVNDSSLQHLYRELQSAALYRSPRKAKLIRPARLQLA